MSEAETPNNQPLPEPTESPDDSGVNLPEEIEAPENPRLVILSELAELKPAVQPWHPEPTTEPDSDTTDLLKIVEVEESASETPDESGQQHSKDADWFALVQKMRQRNRHLLDQVAELRQALKEKQEELSTERTRSREHEVIITQQSEDLSAIQGQLARLFQALESSHQAAQRQQILIETLSEQLQGSQERVAQLERECALVQQGYNEQSHQLLQAANTCRELRTRLHRQQRQTLQFKVALEKSLEMQPPSGAGLQRQPYPNNATGMPLYAPKAPPIQPWSAEPEYSEETTVSETVWNRPLPLESLATIYAQTELFEVRRIEEAEPPVTTETDATSETTVTDSPDVLQDITDTELELEQQLFAEMTSLAEAAGLSEVQAELGNAQAELQPELAPEADEWEQPESFSTDAHETSFPRVSDEDELETQDETLIEDLWTDSTNLESEEPDEAVLPQANWPSPVLYPLRPPKRRKSLAAIELPKFPRFHPS